MEKKTSWQSENLILTALERVDYGLSVIGNGAEAGYCNQKFRDLSKSDAEQHSWASLRAVVDAISRREDLLPAAIPKKTHSVEFETVDDRVLHLKIAPVEGAYSVVTLRDITRRQQSDSRARQHSEQLEAILEHVPHGVSYLDADGLLVVANDEFYNTFAFPKSWGPGTPGLRFTREILRRLTALSGERLEQAARDRLARIYRECATGAVSTDTEHLPDGRIVEIRRRLLPQGSLVETYIDVTERETALAEAQAASGRYRAVVEDQTEMICRFDDDFRITFANRAYRSAFQKPGEDLVGMSLRDLIPEREVAETIIARLAALTPHAPLFKDTFRETTAKGDTAWQTWINRAVFDDAGALVEYQAVGRDVTAEREARDALAQAEKLSAMGSLLASVSHELNNPLSIIVGQAQLLEAQSSDTAALERAGRIRAAADRCARIVRTFLSMARQRPPERSPVELGAMTREAVSLVGYALETSNIAVTTDIADHPIVVSGDHHQLLQIVVNILINAQQAVAERDGPRQVSVRVFHDDETAVLEICDNGPGIDPKVRSKIFEPFFTTKPEGVGTGIGLAVCRNIVLAHDGELEVLDAPGGGALFRAAFPLSASKGPADEGNQTAAIWRSLPELVVLFVDDEPEIADTAREVLSADGHRILTANNGAEALDVLRAEDVDVVVTDLRMPVMDGPALWTAIETEGLHPVSAIGLVTGDALSPDIRRFLDRVGAPVAEKPLDADSFRRLIVEVVSQEV